MLPLLAQNNANDPPDEFLAVMLAGVCGFYLVLLVIFVFFLLTLSKALGQCQARNRTMEPGMVWLNLIPLFNVVWMFITVVRIAESLQNEYYDRGWDRGEDYGKGLGTATCALILASNIPYVGCVFFLGWFVCFIIYWIKIAGYSNQLATRSYAPADDYEDDYDDEEDDRRRRRKRRDRDDDRDDRDDRRDDREDDDDGGRKRRPWDRGGR